MRKYEDTPPQGDDGEEERGGRPSSSGVMIFTLVFVISLVVFGGLGVLWWRHAGFHLPFADSSPTAAAPESTAPTVRFQAADRRAMAVYLTDDNGALQTVTLLLMQPDRGALSAATLPGELSLSDSADDTLARRFSEGGADAAQQALQETLGKAPNFYGILSYTSAERALSALSVQLIFSLPEDVDAQSENGSFSIHLTAGEQALTPVQVSHLLQYTGWQGGSRARASAHAQLFAAFANQLLIVGRNGAEDFNTLVPFMTTNLSATDFQSSEAPLSYLASLNHGDLCTFVKTEGAFEGAGKDLHFIPAESLKSVITDAMP